MNKPMTRVWQRAAAVLVLTAWLPWAAATTPFAQWSETFAADWVRQSAEAASFSQYFSGEEQAALDGQLTPLVPATRNRRVALAQEGLKRLDSFADASLSVDDRVGVGILRWSLQRTLNGQPFDDHGFV